MAAINDRWMHARRLAAVAMLFVGCDATGMVGPEGGTLVSDDGRFTVEIPAGALATDIQFSIDMIECGFGKAIGPCYAGRPHGTEFQVPVEVVYDLADLDAGEDVALVEASSEGWRALPDRIVDLEAGAVFGSTLYLSEYGLARIE